MTERGSTVRETHRRGGKSERLQLASHGGHSGWTLLALVVFTAITYGHALNVPFIGDDYVFLDAARDASFLELWSRDNTDFGWYRPWSRELHFWVIQGLLGAREFGFRTVSLLLWLAMLALYLDFTRRLAGARAATVATLFVASLSLWGAPLTWISGAQDLWMLCFAMLTLWLLQRGHVAWALMSHGLALLSKETAATMPGVIFALSFLAEGRDWRTSARRTLPFGLLTLAWLLVHPVLLLRLTQPAAPANMGEVPLPIWLTAIRSLLSLVNLEQLPLRPDDHVWKPLVAVGTGLLLAFTAVLALRRGPVEAGAQLSEHSPTRLVGFGVVWCAAAWVPLFSPSISWHAYYGGLGVLGAWIALAVVLERWRAPVAVLLLALVLLRGAAAATPSWDWGSEWYQTRAGNMLQVIRGQLLSLHPTLPRHSRLYFGRVPNNIGLVAGRSPAVRVWYDDPTLEAGFYSYYRPREFGAPTGPDLFFDFDSTTGIREVKSDAAPPSNLAPGSEWERDHEGLAMTLLAGGDLVRAARSFELISRLPHRTDAPMFAAVCWAEVGDTARARVMFALARARTGRSANALVAWAEQLRATMPRPKPRTP